MKTEKTTNQGAEVEMGDFGPIYRQFERKPKEAIEYLCKMQDGDCKNALYREDIGYIDIIWGEVTDPIKHKVMGWHTLLTNMVMTSKHLASALNSSFLY